MPVARRLHIGASKVHKWLSLIIGIQLLLWFASGALMSFLPIDKVRGEHIIARERTEAIPVGFAMVPPDKIVAKADGPVEAMTWRMLDGKHVTEVTTSKGVRITAVRTGAWRLYDFFWSLHIMDWKNHEDFNTPWLLAFAVSGLLLGIAGTILLFMRWPFQRRRRAT